MPAFINTLKLKINALWQKSLGPRYDALDEREQRLVHIAAIVLPLIIFIFGIVLPIFDKNMVLKQDISMLAKQVQEANRLADILANKPKQTNKQQGNILGQVDSIARQTGVRSFMTRLRPIQAATGGSQRLQAQIKDAPYKAVVAFIVALEQAGLSLPSLKIQGTKPGYVHMQATIADS